MTGIAIQNAMRFPFSVDRSGGRIREEADYDDYVRQLIRQTLLTNLGERINRPAFGSEIRRALFQPLNPALSGYVQAQVYRALERWLANFIRTDDIKVTIAESTLAIDVAYTVIARGEQRFLNVEVTF